MTKVQTDVAPALDARAVAALTDDTVTSTALAVLIEETAAAIAAAEATAASCKEKAFDLALSHDEAKAAHDRMVDASFRCDRLKTLLPRLRVCWGEALRREGADAWKRERDEFEATVLPDIVSARASYEAALQEILSFFARVTDFTVARGQLLARRPEHLGLESVAEAPIPAVTKMLADTRLFACEGVQLWPDPKEINKLAVVMSQSVLAMAASRDREQFSPFWWRAAQRRQAAAAAEGERRDESLARMASEERERYLRDLAAHGAR
jgi:hypothetical protein